jgi:hypothetical protein
MYPEYLTKAAEKLLPPLVRHARVRKTIPRNELGNLVGMSPELQLPRALEALHLAICVPRGLPDLTGIVVDPDEDSVLSPVELDRVYACSDWDRLLDELGLATLEAEPKELEEEGLAYAKYISVHPGDDLTTRPLIDYIAEHPQVLSLRTWRDGTIEHRFLTGDTCDVLFDRDGLPVIAAIATRHRGSQVVGIYRLIKQRALLEAEKGHGDPMAIQCFLVAQGIPQDIRAYAARFRVSCVTPNFHSPE